MAVIAPNFTITQTHADVTRDVIATLETLLTIRKTPPGSSGRIAGTTSRCSGRWASSSSD